MAAEKKNISKRPPLNETNNPISLDIETMIIEQLPHAVLAIREDDTRIVYANIAAEALFEKDRKQLIGAELSDQLSFSSPLIDLIQRLKAGRRSINLSDCSINISPLRPPILADIHAGILSEASGIILITIYPSQFSDLLATQEAVEGAVKAVEGITALLAHEIKNPLSGIRGAAQLLEQTAAKDDQILTRLICDETDRIVDLINRMEVFGQAAPLEMERVNIHTVLEHVKHLAKAGFGKHVTFIEKYDPSLPDVTGHKDRLIQLYLNLLKNAAEAITEKDNAQITIQTAYRSGLKLNQNNQTALLPIEIIIKDNGPGIPPNIEPHLFDPFISSKKGGSGLGLALAAKIIGEHGGLINHERVSQETIFKTLLPRY